MPVYVVTGKLGSGKTLCAVGRLRDYVRRGCRVASNVDIDLDVLCKADNRTTRLIRVPDKPSAADLYACGEGYEGPWDEDSAGLMLLDELGSWLNSRAWNDKGRKDVIEWCIHARKLRWDVILLVQDVSMIDAQVRSALCEHLVVCKRTDRLRIPVLGWKPPKGHVASVYYGESPQPALRVERWWYRARDLWALYDTAQSFSIDYPHGARSMLPPGYYTEPAPVPTRAPARSLLEDRRMRGAMIVAALVAVLFWWGRAFGETLGWWGDGAAPAADQAVAAPAADQAVAAPAAYGPRAPLVENAGPLDGWSYGGALLIGSALTLLLSDADGIPVELRADTLETMGYTVVDASLGRLILRRDGRVEVLSSAPANRDRRTLSASEAF